MAAIWSNGVHEATICPRAMAKRTRIKSMREIERRDGVGGEADGPVQNTKENGDQSCRV